MRRGRLGASGRRTHREGTTARARRGRAGTAAGGCLPAPAVRARRDRHGSRGRERRDGVARPGRAGRAGGLATASEAPLLLSFRHAGAPNVRAACPYPGYARSIFAGPQPRRCNESHIVVDAPRRAPRRRAQGPRDLRRGTDRPGRDGRRIRRSGRTTARRSTGSMPIAAPIRSRSTPTSILVSPTELDPADYANHSCEPNAGPRRQRARRRDDRHRAGRGDLLRLRDVRRRRLRRVRLRVRHRRPAAGSSPAPTGSDPSCRPATPAISRRTWPTGSRPSAPSDQAQRRQTPMRSSR